jgi:hypothetical protein
LLKASLAFFTLTVVEPDSEQPLKYPTPSPATIPAMNIFGPADRGLAFMKSKLWSLQGYGRLSTPHAWIRRLALYQGRESANPDDLVSRTGDRAKSRKRRPSHFPRRTTG